MDSDERHERLLKILDQLIERLEDNAQYSNPEELVQLSDSVYNVGYVLSNEMYMD